MEEPVDHLAEALPLALLPGEGDVEGSIGGAVAVAGLLGHVGKGPREPLLGVDVAGYGLAVAAPAPVP